MSETPNSTESLSTADSIRAYADRRFIRRYIYLVIACVAVIFWCIYDLQVKYPNEIKRSEAFDRISALDESEQSIEWAKVTKENGWDPTKPDTVEIINGKIKFQYFIAAVCLIGGGYFSWLYYRTLTSWIEANPSELKTSWGKELRFDQILRIDKRKWENKGLAKIVFKKQADDEMERTFVLDDLKYDRRNTDKILELIEDSLQDDQIVNGQRESAVRAAARANEPSED